MNRTILIGCVVAFAALILLLTVQQAMAMTMTGYVVPVPDKAFVPIGTSDSSLHVGFMNVKVTGTSNPANFTDTRMTGTRGAPSGAPDTLTITGKFRQGTEPAVPVQLNFNTIRMSDNTDILSPETTNMIMRFGDGSMDWGDKTITGVTGIMTIEKDTLPVLTVEVPWTQ